MAVAPGRSLHSGKSFRFDLAGALLAALLILDMGMAPRPAAASSSTSSSSSLAQTSATLTGTVLDDAGAPLPMATVLVLGTQFGAVADGQGRFTVRGLPAGQYTIKALKMGYESREIAGVGLKVGETTTLEVRMVSTSVRRLREIVVEGKRSFIQKESSTTRQVVRRDELEYLPLDTVKEAIALKAGVVAQAGELHFRGGRDNEVLYQVDGIPVRDPLGGRPLDVATNAVSEAEVLEGGWDAEYGNAQSGIVNVVTREGGSRFAGEIVYSTDDFGAPDKTYNNLDRLEIGLGGPSPSPLLTWFLSFQGTWQDTYLKTGEERSRHTLLDLIRIGPRQNNDYHLQGKLALTPGPHFKLTLEYLDNQNRRDEYSHVFSRNGFIQTRTDTLEETGEVVTHYGRFSADREDSTFQPYSAPAHTPNVSESFDQFKAVWMQTLSEKSFYTLKVSRHAFGRVDQVQDKFPWEYEGRYPDQWRDQIASTTSPFFATNGDVPFYLDRQTTTWTIKGDWTGAYGSHRVRSGFEFLYNDLSLLSIVNPQIISPDGQIGTTRSQFHYYSPEVACYLQDQWVHEGMVVNAGGRLDVFSVGNQLDFPEVQNPTRTEFSPRIGIAYPVSDRDVFSLHYGRFSQVPDRMAIFENRTSEVLTRGNPDLANQTTVAYQAALQHQFAEDVFGQFGVYFKDIFGLLSVEQVSTGGDPEKYSQYVNRDYASARGFEVTLEKRFRNNFSLDFAYSYGQATGVASDPEQNRVDDVQYLPLAEQPLDWDQRHTFSTRMTLVRPDQWLATAVWTYGSGFPYTPAARGVRKIDPAIRNSARLPSTTRLDLQVEKHYRLFGQEMKIFFRGDNLLDARNISLLEPARFPAPPGLPDNSYQVYYAETGRAGGAYLGPDLNGDGADDWVPVNDPRVFAEGRSLRLGVGVKF